METVRQTEPSRSIPHDLITEILSRLPVKSLCRFRCVSVQWKRTIADRRFAQSHYKHSAARPDGSSKSLILTFPDYFNLARSIYAVDHRDENEDHVAVNLLTVSGFVHNFVSASLNGLICLEIASLVKICNPSTREVITLPKCETHIHAPPSYGYFGRVLFGYDPVNDEHKVLSLYYAKEMDAGSHEIIMENKVFVVGGVFWRTISECPPHSPHSEGVCINGILYYRAWTSVMGTPNAEFVIAFDVHLETFRCIEMPSGQLDLFEKSGLIQYDGRVSIVDYQYLYVDRIYIWVLEDDSVKPKWIHKIVVFPHVWTEFIEEHDFYLAGTLGKGEIIMAPRKLIKPFYLFYFKLKSSTTRRVEIHCMPDYDLRFSGAYKNITATDHVESILSLSGLHGT